MHLQTPLIISTLLGLTVARRNLSQVARERTRSAHVFRRATGEVAQPPAAVSSVNDNDGGSANPGFTCYAGDGSNWPATSQWVSFESMWSGLEANFGQGCSGGVGDNSASETADVRTAIENIAASSQVDHRLILAIIMNESSGCVRVKTTPGGSGIDNPGLMQDYDGYYTCNCNGIDEYNQGCGLVNPCPAATISGMVSEGTAGTNAGSGLADLINTAQNSGAEGAQTFYRAATFYNKGSGYPTGELPQYAIKVANWVTGWQGGGEYSC